MSASCWMRRILGVMVLAAALTGSIAWSWPWKTEKVERDENTAEITLRDAMENPDRFLGYPVEFRCRFAMHGKLFKHFHTEFSPERHFNFAVWPLEAQLWKNKDRRMVLPTLYVDKTQEKVFEKMKDLKRYDAIEIEGRIMSSYASLPWILVTNIRSLGAAKYVITEGAIVNIRQGVKLMQSGEYELAARQFDDAVKKGVPEDQSSVVLQMLGQCKLKSKDYEAAKTNLEEASQAPVESNDREAKILLDLAEAQVNGGDADGAIETCKKLFEISADYAKGYGLLGQAYGMKGNIDEGLAECDTAIKLPGATADDIAMGHVYKARVLVNGQRYADAIREYAQAIDGTSPLQASPWLHKEIGKLYEWRYDETGTAAHLAEAERVYGNASVLSHRQDPESLYLLARVAYKLEIAKAQPDYTKVLDLLNACLAIDPEYADAKVLKVMVETAKGDAPEGEDALKQLLNQKPDNTEARLALAELYAKEGRNTEALQQFGKVLNVDGKNRRALYAHASVCQVEELWNEAKRDLMTLVVLDPADLNYRMQLGRILLNSGDVVMAVEQLGYAKKATGQTGIDALVALGQAYRAQKKLDKAEDAFREAIMKQPESTEAMLQLAEVVCERGRNMDEALALAEEMHRKSPMDPRVLSILGRARIASGDYVGADEALQTIAPVKRVRSDDYHLAIVRHKLSDDLGALECLESAMRPIEDGEDSANVNLVLAKAKELLPQIRKSMPQDLPQDAVAETKRSESEETTASAEETETGSIQMPAPTGFIAAEIEPAESAKVEEVAKEEVAENDPLASLAIPSPAPVVGVPAVAAETDKKIESSESDWSFPTDLPKTTSEAVKSKKLDKEDKQALEISGLSLEDLIELDPDNEEVRLMNGPQKAEKNDVKLAPIQ